MSINLVSFLSLSLIIHAASALRIPVEVTQLRRSHGRRSVTGFAEVDSERNTGYLAPITMGG